tara:strand:+ start:400 stop:1422 length:1023 start_codon:yes stop_codon:yes gene_type:complete
MKDRSFVKNNGPFKISEILERVLPDQDAPSKSNDKLIREVSTIQGASSNDITYLSNKNYLNGIDNIKAAACFITSDLKDMLPGNVLPIVVGNPESVIIDVLRLFYEDLDDSSEGLVSGFSHLASTVALGANSQIKPGVVVKRGVVIGDNCIIDANTTIGCNVAVGHNVLIGSNCTLQNCIVGNNVIIHPGVRIGQDGFGYSIGDAGLKKFPHIGRVIIQDNVEIGSNTTVDRGSLNDTVIGEGTKIDNQVQIAHNVTIGQNCAIAGQVGISGSVSIGNGVMIGGQVGIKQHRKIGDNVQIAAGSGVTLSIPSNQRVAGNPARKLGTYLSEIKTISRIARK